MQKSDVRIIYFLEDSVLQIELLTKLLGISREGWLN